MSLCSKCKHRDSCTSLCSRAEAYVDKYSRGQHELTLPSMDSFSDGCIDSVICNKDIVIQLYKDGKSVSEILYHVPFSFGYVYKIIRRYRDEQKDEVC